MSKPVILKKGGHFYLPMAESCYKAVKCTQEAYYALVDWADDEEGTDFSKMWDLGLTDAQGKQRELVREVMSLWSEKFLIDCLGRLPVEEINGDGLPV